MTDFTVPGAPATPEASPVAAPAPTAPTPLAPADSAPAAASPAPAVDTSDAVATYLANQKATSGQAARMNVSLAQGTNPDYEAELARVSKATGVPLDAARAFPDQAKAQAAMAATNWGTLSQQYPATAKFLAQTNNALLAHDDVQGLANVEGATANIAPLQPGVDYITQGTPTYRQRLVSWASNLLGPNASDMLGLNSMGNAQGEGAAQADIAVTAQRAGITQDEARQAVGGMSPIPVSFARGFFHAATMGLAANGSGTVDSTAAQVAGGAGNLAGFFASPGLLAGKAGTSVLEGSLFGHVAGESFIKAAAKDIGAQATTLGIASGINAAGDALDQNTAGGALATLGKAAGSGAAMGGTFGAAGRLLPDNTLLQTAARVLGVNAVMDAIQGTNPFDNRPTAQKVFDYGLNTVFSLSGAGRTGGGWLTDAARADTAVQDHAALSELSDMATAAKLKGRDPDAFKAFVAAANENGTVQNVYVDAGTLANAMAQSGVKLADFERLMPDAAAQLPGAMSTDGMVSIPVADYATHIAGTKLGEAVLPELRTDPEGMTYTESQEFFQNAHTEFQKAADQSAAETAAEQPRVAGAQAVHDDVLGQLTKAKRFQPDVNEAYASLIRDFYATNSERIGMTPDQMYAKYPLRIAAEDVTGVNAMQQESVAPVATLHGEEIAPKETGLKELRGAASDFYKTKLAGTTVHNPAIGDVQFTGRGMRKMLNSSANPDKLKLVVALPDIIAHGEYLGRSENTHQDKHKNIRAYHFIQGDVTLDGKQVPVRVNVEEHVDGKLYYNHTLPNNEYFQDGGDVQARSPSRPGVITSAERPSTDREHPTEAIGSEPSASNVAQEHDNLNLQIVHQSGGQRGKLSFANDITSAPSVISLLKGADLSTFLHESGHFFLEVLNHMSSQEGAPEAVKADMDTVLKWLGVADLAEWNAKSIEGKRPLHEQFARGFEAYLFEGKAPTTEMQGVFQRFRAWMVNVYRSLSNLHVKLSDDVRAVFDRLLASNDAITSTEAARAYAPLFRTAVDAGMSEQEFEAYQSMGNEATLTASDDLSSRSLKDLRYAENTKIAALRVLQKDVATKRRAIREEVTAQIEQEPVYQAQAYLRRPATDPAIIAAEKEWTDTRDAQRTQLVTEVRAETWEKSAEAQAGQKGIQKGQFLAKNKRAIENEAERRLLQWEQENPKPQLRGDVGSPDVIAEMFGFASGKAMKKAIDAAAPREDAIRETTDQRMLERYGDITSPQAMSASADQAIHNEVRTKFVATELKALAKATGQVSDLTRAAKEVAERTIASTRVRDINPSKFGAAETRSAKQAVDMLKSGDLERAAAAKRNQLLNNQLEKAADAAQTEVEKSITYLKKFGKASVRAGYKEAGDYLAQIDALLDRYDLRTSVSGRQLDRRQSLLDFVAAQRDRGYDPAIPDALLNEAMTGHYKDMSLEAFRGLVDSVKSIEHLGQLKQTLIDGQKARDFADVQREAVEAAGKLPQKNYADPRDAAAFGKGLDRISVKYLNGKYTLRSLDSALLKMEQVVDWLDSHDSTGVFNRIVFRPMAEAGARENDMQKAMATQLREIVDTMPTEAKRALSEKIDTPEIPSSEDGTTSMYKGKLLSIALNSGNDGNYSKMLAGEKWTDDGVQAVLRRYMTKADWDFVQKTWDAIDTLWPHIEALEKRLSGVAPERVEAREVNTPHGVYRGGYFPVVYDPLRDLQAERHQQNSDDLFATQYTRATTSQGHTEARTQFAAPILLSLDVIPRHVSAVIHDITHREAVINADKFLRDKEVRRAIEGAMGREVYGQFRPWLKAIANDKVADDRGLAFWDKAAHWARTSATMVGLGFRVSTAMIHGSTALSNSVGELGPRWMASGINAFVGMPSKMAAARDFVMERSGEMRNRMGEIDRDVRDGIREMQLHAQGPVASTASKGVDAVRRAGFYGVAMLDMASAMPTWMGAYNKALSEGLSEDNAIYAADKSVRNAHGAGGIKDQAAIQRGSEFQKLFTMFYSFWNHFYNRQRDIARTAISIPGSIRDGDYAKASGDFSMVMARSLFYFVIPQLLHAALKPPSANQQDDGHSLGSWVALEMGLGAVSGIPVVRDIANSAATGRDYEPTPAAGAVSTAGHTVIDIANTIKGTPVSPYWVKHSIATAGYVFGLPTGQVATTGQFLWDVMDGRQDPQGLSDWLKGMYGGHTGH